MTKKEKKEIGEILAEVRDEGGFEAIIEIYNCGADWLPHEAQVALNENSELGEEIEEYMALALAKKWAKYAGGKFIPKGGK